MREITYIPVLPNPRMTPPIRPAISGQGPSAGLSAAESREPFDRLPMNDPVVGVFLRESYRAFEQVARLLAVTDGIQAQKAERVLEKHDLLLRR